MNHCCNGMNAVLRRLFFFAVVGFFASVYCGTAFAAEVVPPSVLSSFESFSTGWMSRLAQVSQQNSRNLKPEPSGNGSLVGRYICYGTECAREVRTTGSAATPYVGIIQYSQKTMEKQGETPQKMREHPGVSTGEIQVTEIFRFTKGRWVY